MVCDYGTEGEGDQENSGGGIFRTIICWPPPGGDREPDERIASWYECRNVPAVP